MFQTPVLFIIFNRLETTQRVFAQIKNVKPVKLFIAADGPRVDKDGEREKCERIRQSVLDQIDWDCEVKTLFREKNIGCSLAVSQAITWFFENVVQGIILEDDCLPTHSFFSFCEVLLEQYKDDERIQSIGGTSLLDDYDFGTESYLFSFRSGIWGWATWRRAWDKYDLYVPAWGNPQVAQQFKAFFRNEVEQNVFVDAMNRAYIKESLTWDYQLIFARVINSSFGIIPRVNLVSNIGFGEDATHTFNTDSTLSNKKIEDIKFPLIHPETMVVSYDYDLKYSLAIYGTSEQNKNRYKKKERYFVRFTKILSHKIASLLK